MTTAIASVIDLRPLFDQVVFPLASAALAGVGGWAVQRIARLAHIQMNAKQAQTVEVALHNAIEFALAKANKAADGKLVLTPKNEVVATAVNYILPKIPDTLKSLNITPKGLQDRIEARLASHLPE